MDQVDLLLLHWPADKVAIADQIDMLNAVQAAGKTRFIGVSNQNVAQMKESILRSAAPIVTNQIEVHPYLDQNAVAEAAKTAGLAITAYYGMADGAVPRDPVLQAIGARYGKTAAQVGLRWLIERGFIALSKTAKPERVAENFDIFDFELSAEDMTAISKLARPMDDWSALKGWLQSGTNNGDYDEHDDVSRQRNEGGRFQLAASGAGNRCLRYWHHGICTDGSAAGHCRRG